MALTPRTKRRLLLGSTLFVTFLFYAFTPISLPAHSTFEIDIPKLRRLARGTQGKQALPTSMRTLLIATGTIPRYLTAVGLTRWGSAVSLGYVMQLIYPNGNTLIIDPIHDKGTHLREMPWPGDFYDKAYAQMQQAMRHATGIILTHEHFDHCAGLSNSPHFDKIAPRVFMTTEQLNSPEMKTSGFTPAHIDKLKPLKYQTLHRLMPGVVLRKAAGHTPGSQFIYITLQNGTEFFLVGDLVWHRDGLNLQRGQPRLLQWVMGEDGNAMAHQLRAVHMMRKHYPSIHVIVAHDPLQTKTLIQQGKIKQGLLLKPTTPKK